MEVGGGWWCFSRALSQPVGDPDPSPPLKLHLGDRGLVYHAPPESSHLHAQTSYCTEHTLDTLLGTPLSFTHQIQQAAGNVPPC